MGCDIHCFVEKKNRKTDKWEKISGFKNAWDEENCESPFENRNYREFALLADVRNGCGWGYCPSDNTESDAIRPIALPKGIPEDVSPEVKKKIDACAEDGHSHSYLTAKEISEYDTNNSVNIRGYVNVREYKKFKETGDADMLSQDVCGGNIIKKPNDECIDFQEKNPDMYVFTQIEFKKTAAELARWLFGDGLKQLMERSEDGTGDDVRIVFFFDN